MPSRVTSGPRGAWRLYYRRSAARVQTGNGRRATPEAPPQIAASMDLSGIRNPRAPGCAGRCLTLAKRHARGDPDLPRLPHAPRHRRLRTAPQARSAAGRADHRRPGQGGRPGRRGLLCLPERRARDLRAPGGNRRRAGRGLRAIDTSLLLALRERELGLGSARSLEHAVELASRAPCAVRHRRVPIGGRGPGLARRTACRRNGPTRR